MGKLSTLHSEEELKAKLENFKRFLKPLGDDEQHWSRLNKSTATLLDVLIDEDLKDMVLVLEHFPDYKSVICDHFRYLYNYSNTKADLDAASQLLYMTTEYHTKQFLRNLLRKLEDIDSLEQSQIVPFIEKLEARKEDIHPIIISYYVVMIKRKLDDLGLHKLQQIVILKKLESFEVIEIDFEASDRDNHIDIPYMD